MLSFLTWNIADMSTYVVIGDYMAGFIVVELLNSVRNKSKSREFPPRQSNSLILPLVQISAGLLMFIACALNIAQLGQKLNRPQHRVRNKHHIVDLRDVRYFPTRRKSQLIERAEAGSAP
jgi:hypothetical protein